MVFNCGESKDNKSVSDQNIEKKFITDDLEIIDLFRVFFKEKERIWSWQQKIKEETGARPVHFILLKKLDIIKKVAIFEPLSDDGFQFIPGEELFIYSKKRNLAFKAKARELEKDFIIIPLPERMNILSEELAAKLAIVEREDENSNAHKRGDPRKQATGDQFVQLRKISSDGDIGPLKIINLYDISAGGMGLKVEDPGGFQKGQEVLVYNVNGKELDKPLNGKVLSVRHMEEDDLFKAGIQFT